MEPDCVHIDHCYDPISIQLYLSHDDITLSILENILKFVHLCTDHLSFSHVKHIILKCYFYFPKLTLLWIVQGNIVKKYNAIRCLL